MRDFNFLPIYLTVSYLRIFDFELIGGTSQFLIASKTIQNTRLRVNMVILILHWFFTACANQNKLLLNDLLWSRHRDFIASKDEG